MCKDQLLREGIGLNQQTLTVQTIRRGCTQYSPLTVGSQMKMKAIQADKQLTVAQLHTPIANCCMSHITIYKEHTATSCYNYNLQRSAADQWLSWNLPIPIFYP